MNCIFVCVFNNKNYVNMFYLLLESIFIYGNLDDKTDILIYTSTEFMNIIKESHLFCERIKFEINDTYNDIEKSCKARLDLFKLQSAANYSKILYLDTDILIKGDINKVFDIIEDDIVYVLEENSIDADDAYYGGQRLFGDEINNYADKSAFTSGILLFNNCEKMHFLFDRINDDMINRPYVFGCHDQPYIVYNAFKYGLFNNKVLKSFAVNNYHNINSEFIIHHFPGGPGIYEHKIRYMFNFLTSAKDLIINNNIINAKEYINQYLLPIIHNYGELLEGNIFMTHNTTQYTNIYSLKAKNISNLVLNKNIRNVLEIGFNSGFSALLMLLSNPLMKITCVDLGEHGYSLPCYYKLKETFGDRINIIFGNSAKVLQNMNECNYDLIHIDGGHSTGIAASDIVNSCRLSKQGTIIIMDDYDFHNLHQLWDEFINIFDLRPLNINLYNSPHHDIKYIIKN